jgi:hypothetical protein
VGRSVPSVVTGCGLQGSGYDVIVSSTPMTSLPLLRGNAQHHHHHACETHDHGSFSILMVGSPSGGM